MIGPVMQIPWLRNVLRAPQASRRASNRARSTLLARVFTLLIVAGLALSAIPREDAEALPAMANPKATPVPTLKASDVRVSAIGNFIAGTVWDDTRIRNGIVDDNEGALETGTIVNISIERLEPPNVGPAVCTNTGSNNVVADSNGRYRCEGLLVGLHRVSVVPPAEYEATSPRQRDVTVTATDGGIANFGLAHVDARIRTVGGLVFLDCNENGQRDLAVEVDNRPSSSAFDVRLERTDGSNSTRSASGNNGRYSFDNLDSGTYVVTLEITSSDWKATTSTRREITISNTFGAVVDFGIIDTRGNSLCVRSANATATTILATAVVAADRTATAIVRSGGQGLAPGQSVPPAAATAIAQQATATAQRSAAQATATALRFTPVPTPTPQAYIRMLGAYPRSARFVMQAVAKYPDGRREDMLAEGALIGLETTVLQNAGQRVGSEQVSMRIKRNERIDDIVVTAQQAYRQRSTDQFWRAVTYGEVRNELGLLAPLDALVALRCISRSMDNGQAVVNGAVTRHMIGEVNTLRFWETSIRPQYESGAAQNGSGASPGGDQQITTSGLRPSTSISCTPPAQAVSDPANNRAQHVYQTMQVEAWVGLQDGLIRSERMTARVLPPISDPKEMPDPIELDVVLTFSDVNKPITILPPLLPTPTPVPPTAGPVAAAPAAPAPASGLQPAPDNGRAVQEAPTPGLPDAMMPNDLGTPQGTVAEPQPDQPSGPTPSQREQAAAAERALVAIATGGQSRTGSYARGNNILLDVPFRTQQDNTAYGPTNSGPATMAMALGGYGTDVAVSDLRALINGLDGNYNPGSGVRIETMARVAERGGLNVLDLFRGARFNEWTIEQVREMIRRGYPVVTLVQGAVLPGGTPPGVTRERFVTIIGMDGDDIIYHDPGYPDEGQGAARRIPGRILEQGWLAASTPRLAAGLSLGPEGRGLLDSARGEVPPGASPVAVNATPNLSATVPVIATIEPAPTPAPPEYPFGLPVHPILVLFWLILVVLLVVILVRSLR